jgi:hypothetical protein
MTRNVNGFCPETGTFAPNLEQHTHWSVEKLSFDLITGAFLPDKMPTVGLWSTLRRFFM